MVPSRVHFLTLRKLRRPPGADCRFLVGPIAHCWPLAAVARASLHALRSVIQLNCETAVFIRTRLRGRRKTQARRYATRLWSKKASSASGDGELSWISKLGDRHKVYRCFRLRVIGRWAVLARSCIRDSRRAIKKADPMRFREGANGFLDSD